MTAARPADAQLRGLPLDERRLVRVLPAVPRSAEVARAAARVACRTWGAAEACDTAALLATELVGNSVRHARARELVLRLSMTPRRLRVEVADADPAPARLLVRGVLDDHGRGLLLVTQLAVRWGVTPEGDGGKAVWAEVALAGARGPGS